MDWLFLAPIAAVVSILFGAYLFYQVRQAPIGSEKAAKVSAAITEGANAYLKILYIALVVIAAILAIVLIFLFGWEMALAFVLGAACSAVAGYFGMQVALMANARTATAAKDGLTKAFPIAFNAGGVMGMAVVGLAVLGMSVIYMISRDPQIVLGFSFGASSLALLAKAGGGIYTKTADIGADLVGKVELSLPEDDPRNPAVIADNVGDNVGDVAGMGGDIFDSYVASVVAVMILGTALHQGDPGTYSIGYVTLPIIFAAAGILASIIGMFFVRTSEGAEPDAGAEHGHLCHLRGICRPVVRRRPHARRQHGRILGQPCRPGRRYRHWYDDRLLHLDRSASGQEHRRSLADRHGDQHPDRFLLWPAEHRAADPGHRRGDDGLVLCGRGHGHFGAVRHLDRRRRHAVHHRHDRLL